MLLLLLLLPIQKMKHTCCFPTSAMWCIGVSEVDWWAKGFIRLFCIVLLCFLCILHSLWFCCRSISKWLQPKKVAYYYAPPRRYLYGISPYFHPAPAPSAFFVLIVLTPVGAYMCTHIHVPFIRRCLFVYSSLSILLVFSQSGNRFQSFSLSLLHEIDAHKRLEKSKQASIHGGNSSNKLLLW